MSLRKLRPMIIKLLTTSMTTDSVKKESSMRCVSSYQENKGRQMIDCAAEARIEILDTAIHYDSSEEMIRRYSTSRYQARRILPRLDKKYFKNKILGKIKNSKYYQAI